MGISIHYNGYIKSNSHVAGLVEETSDICTSLEWKYGLVANASLTGIRFAPEGSEPVFLTFTPEGRICSPVNLMMKEIYDSGEPDNEALYTVNTKTQFAGPDAHIAILHLLRYLSKKYCSAFELSDEGCYWETNDRRILQVQFDRYNAALDAVTGVLSNLDFLPGEEPASLVERIERLLRKPGNRR